MISKWTVLILACMVTFGMYYSFDSPSVLHEQLYHHFKKKNEPYTQFEFDFSLIYSVYSLPNTFLPLIGGLLVDKFGNNRIMLIFGLFVLVGNFIQTFACITKNMSVYIFGRFIFGVGAETLGVCGNTIVSRWFKGAELAFALAINLSFCKLAGVMNDWISPVVEEGYGVDVTSYSVSFVCLVCYILTIILVANLPRDEDQITDSDTTSEHIELGTTSYYQIPASDDPNSTEVSHNNVQEYQEYLRETSKNNENEVIRHTVTTKTKTPNGEYINEESVIEYHRRTSESSGQTTEKPGCMREFCSSMCQLNANVWILFIFTFLMYGVFLPFNNISNPILLEFFFKSDTDAATIQKDLVYAAQLQSIPYFLSVFVNPVLGISIDWLGYRTTLFTFSAVTLIVGHSCIYYHIGPILPLMLLGVAYSTFATVLWACVPVVVRDELTGTAYGLMASFQNTAQFVVPLILQHLFATDNGSYATCELFFLGMASAGLILAIVMWILDEKFYNGVLRLPTLTNDGASASAAGGSGAGSAAGGSGAKGEYSALNGHDTHTHQYVSGNGVGGSDSEHKFFHGGANGANGGGGFSEWGNSLRPLSRNNSMQEPRPYRIKDTFVIASHFPFSGSPAFSTPSPSFASDHSSSPEPVISKVPVRIVPIPTLIQPGSFAIRSPFRASLQGQFPQADSAELLKQVAEKNRMVAPPVPFNMMTPGSYKVMAANGGANRVAIPYYFSDAKCSSPVAMPAEQQYLIPKKMTKAQSFHSYGSRF